MSIAEKLLALILFMALCAGGGFFAGYRAATNKLHAEQLTQERDAHTRYVEGVKRAIDQADELAAQNAEFESASVQRLARIERVFQTINREVIRYVQTDAGRGLCFDDGGLRLYNAANRGEFPAPDQAAPGAIEPGGMPAAAAGSKERLSGRSSVQPRLGGQNLFRLQGTPSGTGGMGEAQ